MSRAPTPKPSSSLSRASGTPEQRGPGSIDYVDADVVGFELLPEPVRRAVSGLLVGGELAADAGRPMTKRRPDASHYQHSTAWWASSERLVLIEARRALLRVGEGRFRPAGDWRISGEVLSFPGGLVPEQSRWRFNAGSGGGLTARQRKATDALDALPPALAAPVLGGESSAWQHYLKGWALETVVAHRRVDGRARVLRAEREATSLRSLASADWAASTLDAKVISTSVIEQGAKGSVRLASAATASRRPPLSV